MLDGLLRPCFYLLLAASKHFPIDKIYISINMEIWKKQTSSLRWGLSPRNRASIFSGFWFKPGLPDYRPGKLPNG